MGGEEKETNCFGRKLFEEQLDRSCPFRTCQLVGFLGFLIDFDIAMGDPTPGQALFGSSGVFWTVADRIAADEASWIQSVSPGPLLDRC